MKVNKLIMKMYKAILKGDKNKERRLWFRAMRKSLKHKHTEAIK